MVTKAKNFYTFQISELQDAVNGKETEAAELRNQIDDLQYELSKVQSRNDKLENHLLEATEKVKLCQQMHTEDGKEKDVIKPEETMSNVSQKKVSEGDLRFIRISFSEGLYHHNTILNFLTTQLLEFPVENNISLRV